MEEENPLNSYKFPSYKFLEKRLSMFDRTDLITFCVDYILNNKYFFQELYENYSKNETNLAQNKNIINYLEEQNANVSNHYKTHLILLKIRKITLELFGYDIDPLNVYGCYKLVYDKEKILAILDKFSNEEIIITMLNTGTFDRRNFPNISPMQIDESKITNNKRKKQK